MNQFVRDLLTEWRRLGLPFGGSALVVATSGGADSVSLLIALDDLIKRKKMNHRLIAAHFNHRLRDGASDDDENFVRKLTTERRIELAVGSAKLETVGNLEQNARHARYDFLLETARRIGAFAVVTGHTMNDQAETVLMNLLRGSGPDGLAGMRPIRTLGSGVKKGGNPDTAEISGTLPLVPDDIKLIRPLLNWALRCQTEAFCHELNIEYRYDTMNEDTAYRRVRIRKVLMPLLYDFNPRIVETLGNTARLMQNVADRPAQDDSAKHTADLTLDEIRTVPKAEMYDKIRSWLRKRRGSTRQLQLKHLEAVERLAFSTKSGRAAELPGGRVIKRNGSLIYEENKVEN